VHDRVDLGSHRIAIKPDIRSNQRRIDMHYIAGNEAFRHD